MLKLRSDSTVQGRAPHLLALACLALLVCGLLVSNYLAQRSLQLSNLERLQQNFGHSTAHISYFLSERETDLADLVTSKTITSFFSNKNLGMSMVYGLKASLNFVTRLLRSTLETATIDGVPIYSHLSLLDLDGSVLTGWPGEAGSGLFPVPEKSADFRIEIKSYDNKFITFTAPVVLYGKVQGYLRAAVSYQLLGCQLIGDNEASTHLVITENGSVVFMSDPEVIEFTAAQEKINQRDVTWPMEIPGNTFLDLPASQSSDLFTLFYSDIPRYGLKFFLAEKSKFVNSRQALIFSMSVLAAISLGGLISVGSILRAGTRNLLLTASLAESEKREKAVAEKNEELDSIIRNFLDTLIVVNTQLIITKVNQATCTLLNFDEEELVGRDITRLFHDPADHVQSIFSFYTETEKDRYHNASQLRNIELSYHAKDGSILPMSFNISLLHGSTGGIVGVVAGAKDISNLKAAMDEIACQKEYIENLFDVVPEGLVALNPSIEIITCNKAFLEIIKNWSAPFDWTEQEVQDKLLRQLKNSLTQAKSSSFMIENNYNRAWFEYAGIVDMRLPEDVEYVLAIRDVTEERKASAERRLLATVVEQIEDSVIIMELDGSIRYANPATLRNSGYSDTELQKTILPELAAGRQDQEVYRDLWSTVHEGKVWSGRYSFTKKDGTVTREDVTISPVRNEAGEIAHFVAIKRDVTQMEILQAQLLQAKKMEAIGQLAAGISHEINTPMQYVLNNVSFLRNSCQDLALLLQDYQQLVQHQKISLPESAVDHFNRIKLDFLMEEVPEAITDTQSGVMHVVKIVSAMKEFSHPGSDRKAATDLNHAIGNIITVSRNEWKYVAEIETDLDPELPMVPCLIDQMNQVMINLIVNSAQAIAETGACLPDNAGKITISTRHVDDWAEVRVSDTGRGIPADIKDRIFDPFFTTKEVGKGTGQGLTLVHDIVVQRHGGKINIDTVVGEGTTFSVRLPLQLETVEAVK